MNPPDARRLSELLDSALDLPPDQRESWIEALEVRDAALKARLRALLGRAAGIESRAFLASLPRLSADDSPTDDSTAAGDRIGPYRLERPLGAGGMGTVWLATRADGLFQRTVALKLPLRGMFGADLAERMARERGILAGLEHPNIARLYDAGLSEQGQPYLALEYVDGTSIDEYCRQESLDTRARLGLFLQIADAVAAAHARLVVHRDLKPANILVTRDGQVRLLDFGVAKLLEQSAPPGPPLTQLSVQALTPDYASPEQIRGEPVTIASDIYSLGVVLYELLAGARPYRLRRDSRGALEDAILESQPRAPSAVDGAPRALRGDLDTIVLKSLHKAPAERYPTVNAFAEDVRRYLQGRPVVARPDSGWYRARRFLRRHALASATAAAVTLAIFAATGVALSQAQRAEAERRRAEDVNRFIKSIFTSADPYEAGGGGQSLSALDLLKQAYVRVNREFVRRPEQRVELLNTLTMSVANLSDYDTADTISREALQIAMLELPPGSIARREARVARLTVDRMRGRIAELRRGVDALLAEPHPDPRMRQQDRIRLLLLSAHAAIDEGRFALAASHSGEAFDIATRLLGAGDPDLLEAAVLHSVSLRYAGELEQAEAAALKTVEAALRAAAGDAANARVLDARMALGSIYIDTGKPRDAIRELQTALAGAPRLYGADSEFETYVHSHLARACLDIGEQAAALAHIDRSLELTRAQSDEESRNLALATASRGHILLAMGDAAAALAQFDAALPFYRRTLGDQHDATLALRIDRSLALARRGQAAAAVTELAGIQRSHPQLRHWMVVSPAYALGVALRLGGHANEALRTQRAALAALPSVPRRERLRMAVLDELGASALAAGEFAEAEAALREALALHARLELEETPGRHAARLALDSATRARGLAAR